MSWLIVAAQTHALTRQRIEMRRPHHRMRGDREAIGAELIECNEEYVHGSARPLLCSSPPGSQALG